VSLFVLCHNLWAIVQGIDNFPSHEGSFEIKTPGEGKAKKAQPLVTPHQKKARKLKFLIRT
jgi:hypothetical protein